MNQEEFFEERLCGYRNCTNPIFGRLDKKYCCREHKTYEKIYRKRREEWLKKYSQLEYEKVKSVKDLINIIEKKI